MPLQIGGVAVHDDRQHTGSAKRNAASGVKGIDASQNLTPKLVMADIDGAIQNAALGLATLDAAAKFAGLVSSDPAAVIGSGSYTGNSTANRAIAHGLGRTPKMVIVLQHTSLANGMILVNHGAAFLVSHSTSDARTTVTAMDSTNFYVGNAASYDGSANLTGLAYTYVAIG